MGERDDRVRIEEIASWFEEQGFSFYLDDLRPDLCAAWVIPPGIRVGVVPPISGATRLEAAENAYGAAQSGRIPGIVVRDKAGNVTIYAPTATVEASSPASAASIIGSLVDANLHVTDDARRALEQRDALDRKLGEFGWTLLFTREPGGGYLWVVADARSGEVIQHGTGDDWEDSKLEAIIGLYPPSDEGLAG